MHWLIDGYNLIRRDPALASREAESLEAGRVALCRLLGQAARSSGDRFTVVFEKAEKRRRRRDDPGTGGPRAPPSSL